ncbi:hypothetical protein HK100_009107 [Physocladia obscura]|uniref:Uncharacterized protein n=1 Tax=Physocladia obscura TaxID=109957 RepID=A0AAD5X651_9FUNG|nr:hypothetical protein HK100_009107 [Physocladia obscura]
MQSSQHKIITSRAKSKASLVGKSKLSNPTGDFNKLMIPETFSSQLNWENDFIFEEQEQIVHRQSPERTTHRNYTPTATAARKTTDRIPIAAEIWDEDFDLTDDTIVAHRVFGESNYLLKDSQPHVTSKAKIFTRSQDSQQNNTDYTEDFDLSDNPSLFSFLSKCQNQESALYTAATVMVLMDNIRTEKNLSDSCFELAAVLEIAPQLIDAVVVGNNLNMLLFALESANGEQQALGLMTLLNKLISSASDSETNMAPSLKVSPRDRLTLLGIVPSFSNHAARSKSLDIRREFLHFVTQMSTSMHTLCALLAARTVWSVLLALLDTKDPRSRNVAFDSVGAMSRVFEAIPDAATVDDQVSVLYSCYIMPPAAGSAPNGGDNGFYTRILRVAQVLIDSKRSGEGGSLTAVWESVVHVYSVVYRSCESIGCHVDANRHSEMMLLLEDFKKIKGKME